MKKIRAMIASTKGFTLVEVIITMTICMLLLIPVSEMLLTSRQVFNSTNHMLEYKTIALAIEEKIKAEVRFTSQIELLNEKPTSLEGGQKALYIKEEDGVCSLIREDASHEKPILDKGYMKHYKVELNFEKVAEQQQCLLVKIKIEDTYTLSTVIKIENLRDKGIEGWGNQVLIYDAV